MIKVTDLAFVRFRAPDLDRMEKFLTDFGLMWAARTEGALYMRGTDSAHHIHVTELGDPEFVGIALHAASAADLDSIAGLDGASAVEDIDEPGGGRRVRLADPDGLAFEVVHGIHDLDPIAVRDIFDFNSGSKRRRIGPIVRSGQRPSQVKRLGHVVLRCANFDACEAFYKDAFGFLTSDYLHDDDDETIIRADFLRCDRGQDYTDHHTLLATTAEDAGLGHVAFEVEDWNDLAVGHHHMAAAGHVHNFGIGRHILGSQIFDYWSDPWGRNHEHWTDGDLLNEDWEPGRYPLITARDVQWSPPREN